MSNRLNKFKYPGAKRLMLEAQELRNNTEDYCAQPLEDNLFEWHFTVRGPPDTAFDGGFYHGRLSFPTEYPMKPPSIIVLTPNGRFEINKKICLSISGHHPETWQPSWSVRTALLALIAFMPTKANRAIGSLDFSDAERRKLAQRSRTWKCETCGLIKNLLVDPNDVNLGKIEEEKTLELISPAMGEESSRSPYVARENELSISEGNISNSESRDSTNDSESYEYETSRDNNDLSNQNSIKSKELLEQKSNNRSIPHSESHSPLQEANLDHHHSLVEPRRAHSALVLRSIFILLSLLILRRVVMVIQA